MGSPVSPIVANMYMEDFEDVALSTAPNPPSMWVRYVDDTFIKLHEYHVDEFTSHINSIDHNIQFTTEPELEGKLPFLDLCVHVLDDGGTKLTIYRKPTHTDQYLNFQSNHPLEHKRSVVRTLTTRCDSYVTLDSDKRKERAHIHEALAANDYPKWAMSVPKKAVKDTDKTHSATRPKGPMIGILYISGVSERLQRVFKEHNINVYHKPYNKIRNMLVHPKDPTPNEKKCGIIYELTCNNDPSHKYIGETKRTLGERFKEHKNKDRPTAVGEHSQDTGHSFSLNNSKVLTRESNWTARKIKEAIYIRTKAPSINRDQGYQLAPVYHQLLPEPVLIATASSRDQGP